MTSSAPTIGNVRLDWIEWVRGLASVLVVAYHFLVPVWPGFAEAQAATVDIGRAGVVAFFLVSGFVVPLSYRRQPTDVFVVRRTARLYPVYWIVLAVTIVLSSDADWSSLKWWGEVILNMTMLQGLLSASIVGVAWTLTIEIIYYFQQIAFKSLKLLDSAWLFGYLWATAFLVAIALEHVLGRELPVTFPLLLAVACIGHVLSLAYGGIVSGRRAWTFSGTVFVALIIGGLCRANVDERWPALLYVTSTIAGVALFGVAYLLRNRLKLRWAVWLGGISYALYLVHDPALSIIKTAGAGWEWLAVGAAVIVSFAGAWLLHVLVEKPSIRWGRRYQARDRALR